LVVFQEVPIKVENRGASQCHDGPALGSPDLEERFTSDYDST
jgi:hypothetical protein